jgi:hypothetical protein
MTAAPPPPPPPDPARAESLLADYLDAAGEALPPGSPLPTVRVAPRFVFVVRAPGCAVAVALPAAVDPAHARAQTSPGGGRVRVRLPLAEA